jgi:glycosyltransferase involved in cell wall biosynthesis
MGEHMLTSSVTVVIPCYNAEKYVDEAISSVKHQMYPNIRIIVVDDKSTDSTIEKVSNHSGVTVIQHSRNEGACSATETGFKESRTDYTCMLAADDVYIDPDHISKQVKYMEEHTLDWSYDGTMRVGSVPRISNVVNTKWFGHSIFDNLLLELLPKFCCLLMIRRNPVNASSMMIRTEAFRKHNLSWCPKVRSVCDGYLIADMLLKGLRGGVMSNGGVFYRIHPRQVSNIAYHKDLNNKFRKVILKRVLFGGTP